MMGRKRGRIRAFWAACLLTALAGAAFANTETVGGYTWTYSVRGKAVSEGGTDYVWTDAEIRSVSPKPEGEIEVPSRLGVWPVSFLGASLFKGCTKLTSVTLPTSVTNVGSSAFKGCSSLSRVRILAPAVRFGTRPFADCPAVAFAEMPTGSAFSTLFPDAVTNLREAVVSEGSTSLVRNAFRGCAALASVTLPDSVGVIGASAFEGCTNLTSVTLPTTVTNVGSSAFKGCSSLSRIRVLSPTVKFGTKPFAGCTAAAFAEVPGGVAVGALFPDSRASLREVVVAEGAEKLANSFLKGYTNLVCVSLPSTLETIGTDAFRNCTSLKALELPASVRKISQSALVKCTSLATLTVWCDRPSSDPNLKDAAEDLVVRVPSSSAGWDGIAAWGGRPFEFFVDGSVPYVLEPLDPARIVMGLDVPKAVAVGGCVMDGAGAPSSVVELKIGRAGRKGSKINAALTGIDGKRTTFASATVDLSAGPAEFVLRKPVQAKALRLVLGRDETGAVVFSGWWGNHVVRSAPVGGEMTKQAAFTFPEGFARELPGGVVTASFLPENEPVAMAGRRWNLAGAAKIAYRKDRATGLFGWTVNGGKADSPKTNLSGLKLQYAPKQGTFKGSFTAYLLRDDHLRKASVKVTGVVVGGVGYGQAAVLKAEPWPVLVK